MDGNNVWVEAFERCRSMLTAFARAKSADDLHLIRDSWELCLSSVLCRKEYQGVRADIKANGAVSNDLMATITTARRSPKWTELRRCVADEAEASGGDVATTWNQLEKPRLAWLNASRNSAPLRKMLQSEVEKARQGDPDAEEESAKAIWVYGLGYTLPSCQMAANMWATCARINTPTSPLVGYQPELWDVRRPEFRALEQCVLESAERAGTSLSDEWHAK